ncbi:MAG TPA: VWA domain-containing protein [Thermoanaerobaculia bacterium]|jgi:Ca-activated chloride channel family protein|nr:VWA domain-containing protein [Thermoanaerobaculia bacterium]
MSFAAPSLLALALLAPLAASLALWLWRRRLAADGAWAAPGLWGRLARKTSQRRIGIAVATLALAVLGAALALARPRWGVSSVQVERRGIDVVFVLDSSLSMAAFDVEPSRLETAKVLLRRLAAAMPENRLGLVQTEGEGIALSPLTLDAAAIDLMLDTVEPGSLSVPGTELATGFERAIGLFPEGGERHRAIVLLSDGEDHGGDLTGGIERLKKAGVVVSAIGIGTEAGGPLKLPSPEVDPDAPAPDQPDNFKRDRDGRVVISRLHEESLETLARATGGIYLRATSAGLDLAPIVRRIGEISGRTLAKDKVETQEERFQWPLALAALALAVHLFVRPFAPSPRVPRLTRSVLPRAPETAR